MAAAALPPTRTARRGGADRLGKTAAERCKRIFRTGKVLFPHPWASCDACGLSPKHSGSRTPSHRDCHRANSKAVIHFGISPCNAVNHTPALCLRPYSTAPGSIYHGKKVANTCVSATFLKEYFRIYGAVRAAYRSRRRQHRTAR